MEEIWKDVEGFERLYQVSNLGNVKSLANSKTKSEKILKYSLGRRGYCQVVLSKSNNKYYMRVHRLVAQAFIPNPENKPEVNHINGIRNDNRVENLEWCTQSENQIHAYRIGLQLSGENIGTSKLKNADIPIIRQMLTEGITQIEIAEKYNVAQSQISLIKLGKNWKHVA